MSKKVKTSPTHLKYWCITSVIDRVVCQRKGMEFDEDLAAGMENKMRYYFVVDKKGGILINIFILLDG